MSQRSYKHSTPTPGLLPDILGCMFTALAFSLGLAVVVYTCQFISFVLMNLIFGAPQR